MAIMALVNWDFHINVSSDDREDVDWIATMPHVQLSLLTVKTVLLITGTFLASILQVVYNKHFQRKFILLYSLYFVEAGVSNLESTFQANGFAPIL